MGFMSDIQLFLNDERTIKVLYFLVLLTALVWVTTGFRFLEKSPRGKNKNKKNI
jgi:hypothetical protein